MSKQTEITSERLAKLPAWARDHVDGLERALKRALGQVEELRAKYDGGEVRWGFPGEEVLIPGDEPVRFGHGLREGDCLIDVRWVHGKELRVSAESGSLLVQPQSSNVVRIRATSRLGSWNASDGGKPSPVQDPGGGDS